MFPNFRHGTVLPIAGMATFATFVTAFGACAFKPELVGECSALVGDSVGMFKAMGDQVIDWVFAVFTKAMR